MKEAVINLADTEIPESHRELLNLGPKFVPNIIVIPNLDIVSRTESPSLKLEYSGKIEAAQTLRKEVLRLLKTSKPPKDNLLKNQRVALTEIKNHKNISVYPFDKASGFVRIDNKKCF